MLAVHDHVHQCPAQAWRIRCNIAILAVHGVQICGVGAGKVLGDWQLCGVKPAGAGGAVLMLRWAEMAPHDAGPALGRWQGRAAELPWYSMASRLLQHAAWP